MEWLLSLGLGVGLSAACGFRVFVPLLVMSVAAHAGHLQLSPGFQWIGTWPATVAFGAATMLEIVAYLIPWLDHLLDAVATPAAVVAGVVVSASLIVDVSPLLRWSLAIIAGGGSAAVVQAATVSVRATSTATTAGVANPAVAVGESVASFFTSMVSLVVPLLAIAVLSVAIGLLLRRLLVRRTA